MELFYQKLEKYNKHTLHIVTEQAEYGIISNCLGYA
jgi:hypothetical protein